MDRPSLPSVEGQPVSPPPIDVELAHMDNARASLQDNHPLFNGAEYFAHDNEPVDEGMLVVFSDLDISFREHLWDAGHPIAHCGDHEVFVTNPRSLLKEPQPEQHLPIYSSQLPPSRPESQCRVNDKTPPVHQTQGSTAETRLCAVKERLKEMSTSEKVALIGRIISEGRIPEAHRPMLRRKIVELRKRYQVEKALAEQAVDGQLELLPAPEDALEAKVSSIGSSAM